MERKLRILCLHGYHQHAHKFRAQTGGMRKFLKSYAEFIFVSAPHLLKGVEVEERAWWFSKSESFSSKDDTDIDPGFEQSLNFLQETFKSVGPFDGILGFSQGAALAAILASLQQSKQLDIDFKFVIIISGFMSKCSKHSKYYMEKISLPSLHVIGESDEIVNKSVSEKLAQVFIDPVIMRHDGGHHVPHANTLKQLYREFLTAQQENIFRIDE